MKLEYEGQFADNMSLISNADFTNILDLGVANPYPGSGTPIWIHCKVHTTLSMADASSSTLTVAFKSAATSDGTYTTHYITSTAAGISLTAGTILIDTPIPHGVMRYVKMTSAVLVTCFSAGTVDAYLTLGAMRKY